MAREETNTAATSAQSKRSATSVATSELRRDGEFHGTLPAAGDRGRRERDGNSWPHLLQVRPFSLIPPPQMVQKAARASAAMTGKMPRIMSHMPTSARAGQRVGTGGTRHRLNRSHAATSMRATRCRLRNVASGSGEAAGVFMNEIRGTAQLAFERTGTS